MTIISGIGSLFSRQWLVVLMATLLLSGCAASLPPRPDVAHGQGLLWQIEKEGLAPSYVFGTLHVTDLRLRDLPVPVRDAFDAADRAVFEVILDAEAINIIAQAAALPRGQHLKQFLDEQTYSRTIEVAGRYGIPAGAVGVLRPWVFIGLFSIPPAEQIRHVAGHLMFDAWLQQRAIDDGKEVLGLERAEEQLSLFADMRSDDQLALLKSGLRQADEINAIFNNMLEAYLVGDLSRLYAMLDDYNEDFTPEVSARFKKRLLVDRNHRMVGRMAPFLMDGAFVAVGALHLPGPEGILDLLEKQGYRVTRVY